MALKPGRQDKIFIGIVVLVHIVFFLLACHYTRIYMGDSLEYIYEALNIRDLFFFYSGSPVMPITPEYMTLRQPLYPLFLLCVYLFTVNNWVVIVLQNILSVINIYYVRKVFTEIGYQKKYDWLLLLFIIAYPAQFINANTIAPDILLQTCTVLYFGNFISFIKTKQIKYAVWTSVLLIAGFMVKPVLYPFVVIHAVLLIIIFQKQRIKMQRPLLIAMLPFMAVMVYSFWNYTRTDKVHFTSNQAQNAIYYYDTYIACRYGSDSANTFLQNEKRNIASLPEYKDRYDYANDRGAELITHNFFRYARYHLKNSLRILIEPGKAELDLFTGALTYGRLYHKEQTGFYATLKDKGLAGMNGYIHSNPSFPIVIFVLLFNIIRLIWLIIFFFNRTINGFIRVFIFILIGYFALIAGPIANTRYFIPVSLIMVCAAVMGSAGMLQKKQAVG